MAGKIISQKYFSIVSHIGQNIFAAFITLLDEVLKDPNARPFVVASRDWFLVGSRAKYLGLQISPRVQVQEADEGTIAKELLTFGSRWFLIIRDARGGK